MQGRLELWSPLGLSIKPLRKPRESEKHLQPALFGKSAGWLSGVARAGPAGQGFISHLPRAQRLTPALPLLPQQDFQPRGNKNMKEAVDCAAFSVTFCCNEIIAWMNKRGLYNYSK